MQKFKKSFSPVDLILILLFLCGAAVIAYPSLSDWWNSFHQSRAAAGYEKKIEGMDQDQIRSLWDKASSYNRRLSRSEDRFHPSKKEERAYRQLLDVSGTGIMASLIIPDIHVNLPVYHGTGEEVLQKAIGHLEGTSLPVGGSGTHSVLSGHRGLPSARLFSDIDQLKKGDRFMVSTLGRMLTYEVDQVKVVLPDQMEDLGIEEGEDYMTLLTCTPYGINTHRLLVRGKRVEGEDKDKTRREGIAKTGDDSRILFFVLLAFISLILIWRFINSASSDRL